MPNNKKLSLIIKTWYLVVIKILMPNNKYYVPNNKNSDPNNKKEIILAGLAPHIFVSNFQLYYECLNFKKVIVLN